MRSSTRWPASRRTQGGGLAVRAAGRGVGPVRDRAGARGVRRGRPRPGAARREPGGLRPRRRARLSLRPDRRRRRARGIRRGARRRPAPDRHAGEDLGDAARRERGGGARLRTSRRVDDQPADRPDARADRGDPRRRRRAARLYVEAPDNVGGFIRHHEIPGADPRRRAGVRQVRPAQRPDVYPAGTHLEATTIALSRERVRRARLGLELLARSGYEASTSELGAAGLAVPVTTQRG